MWEKFGFRQDCSRVHQHTGAVPQESGVVILLGLGRRGGDGDDGVDVWCGECVGPSLWVATLSSWPSSVDPGLDLVRVEGGGRC